MVIGGLAVKTIPGGAFSVILKPKDYVTVPWKNGAGTTSQIAIFPNTTQSTLATESSFHWRLSSAVLTQPTPFSNFPGCDRILTLIEGEELTLHNQTQKKVTALKRGEIARFPGEDQIEGGCRNPVTDLGLIFSRAHVTADCQTMAFSGKPRSLSFSGTVAVLFSMDGDFRLTVGPKERKFQLRSGETFLYETRDHRECLVFIEPLVPRPIHVLVIEISSIASAPTPATSSI